MIDLKGLLEPVWRGGRAGEHATGVVRQHVDSLATPTKRLREVAHFVKPGEVGQVILGSGGRGDRLRFSGERPTRISRVSPAASCLLAAAPMPSLAPVMMIVRISTPFSLLGFTVRGMIEER